MRVERKKNGGRTVARGWVSFSAMMLALSACSSGKLIPLEKGSPIPTPATITFKISNYCPFHFIDFFAKPLSFEESNGQLLQDFNQDGLTDQEALNFGISPFNTPASGISDFIGLIYLGLTPNTLGNLPTCANPQQTSSGDILVNDCERSALGLSPLSQYDPIQTGIPDGLRIYARLPLLEKHIGMEDLAGDGWTVSEKIRANLRPDQSITPAAQALAVKTQINVEASLSMKGNVTSGTNVVSVASGASIPIEAVPGMSISGAGIPLNQVITQVTASTLTFGPGVASATGPSTVSISPATPCYEFDVTSPRASLSNGDAYAFYFISSDTSGTSSLTMPTVPPVAAPGPGGEPDGVIWDCTFVPTPPQIKGTTSSGSNVVTGVSSITNVSLGMVITGNGIPSGQSVTGLTSSTITFGPGTASSSNSAEDITFNTGAAGAQLECHDGV